VRGVVRQGRRGLELRAHPDDGSLRAALHRAAPLAPGDVVALRFEGGGRVRPGARLGRVGDPDLDFAALSDAFGLPERFPAACLRELDALAEDGAGALPRLDLRPLPFVTIDPARARDHDDAVFAEPEGAGFRLWVAIADVSHYVPAGSALDREARARGNSVYLPDRVVPMLPPRLSGDLCSLVPDEDRPALAVEVFVDADGAPQRRRVAAAWIRSRARLAYERAAAWMAGEPGADAGLSASLGALAAAARRLRERRVADGSLDLELIEPEPEVDAAGRVVAIRPAARTEAHRAIEEAMLAVNRGVAALLVEAGRPTLHRVHEPPDPRELAGLEPVLATLGLWPGRLRRAPGPEDLPELAEAARERGLRAVQALLVRSMRQARYAERPLGHFALAFEHYLHFTSPIRRYADLVVHRAVKALLARERPPRAAGLADLAEHLSLRERAAAKAEYQALDWKRAALLLPRVGQLFDGRVSGVAAPGLFVTLDAVCGDGLVPLGSLPRHAHLDLRRMRLTLGRTRVALGDAVRVRLVGVDPGRGRFRLALAGYSEEERSAGRARRSHSE
jgi:ribonuclease R